MEQDQTYGDQVTLQAISNIYTIQICVLPTLRVGADVDIDTDVADLDVADADTDVAEADTDVQTQTLTSNHKLIAVIICKVTHEFFWAIVLRINVNIT